MGSSNWYFNISATKLSPVAVSDLILPSGRRTSEDSIGKTLSPTSLMAEIPAETVSSSAQPSSTQKSPEEPLKQSQVLSFSGFPPFPDGYQMFPVMYPALVPGLNPLQNQEEVNRGAGIYAVPVYPFMGPVAGLPSNNLIPLTYSTPMTSSESGAVHENHGQAAQQQYQQQQPAPQRQVVVRRFQIAFQIDLLLILKLAAVIFLFNQDGSRQRLVVLVLFASIVYLYQTGALTPIVRWLSQGMQRAAAPPHPPRPAVRGENIPPARQGNENAAAAEGQPEAEIENQPAEDGNRAVENENVVEPGAANGANHWWGVVKEIQMIVFGFITSLLPGFHNID
ncbi:Transmembrane protein [Quillaja saponaria]|uniref:Transmembrane protein n=1 Tax=Quillaja saponaria TaxID=32244 RepID=A0AAD7QDA7_QUISA|nr:Transmembrane protein [Quillaja saponaria]